MKRLLKISLILLIYMLLCGKSCVDDPMDLQYQEKEVNSAKENIRNEFEKDYLPEESRYALEQSAVQKLNDLNDYLAVFTDTSQDSMFRTKAGEMAKEIFISDEISLSFDTSGKEGRLPSTLGQLLKEVSGKREIDYRLMVDSIMVLTPLHRSAPGSYQGTLLCKRKTDLLAPGDTSSFYDEIIVEMFASRVEKVFGDDTLNVWSVSLGNMIESKKSDLFNAAFEME